MDRRQRFLACQVIIMSIMVGSQISAQVEAQTFGFPIPAAPFMDTFGFNSNPYRPQPAPLSVFDNFPNLGYSSPGWARPSSGFGSFGGNIYPSGYQGPRPISPIRRCRENGACKPIDHGTTIPTSWRFQTTTTPIPATTGPASRPTTTGPVAVSATQAPSSTTTTRISTTAPITTVAASAPRTSIRLTTPPSMRFP